MRNKISILLGAAMMAATLAIFAEPAPAASPPPIYTCLMHPEVRQDHPGECPKCGMTLVRKKDSGDLPAEKGHGADRMIEHEAHRLRAPAAPEMGGMPMTHMTMTSSINLADPMSRESSGTSWVPDSTPTYGKMFMLGDNMLMLHGGAFPRYTNVSTRRGDDRIDLPNWAMAMFSHPIGDFGQLGFRGMMSLDPLTEGGRGYPLLFQSGESWHDEPLHDRQHPHDLFDELSATYSQKFGHDLSGYLYLGYPGEPALGSPTFMHRLSAMDNPDAPISHHWQDSTHITFGVVTLGAVWRNVKVEGSIFNGSEPDENRYDFDRLKLNSFSGRLSWNPTKDLALQVSHGYVKSPEALEPQLKVHRTTASLIYNRPLGPDSNWSSSFVWGQNRETGEGKTQSFLFETNYQRGRDTIYARWEHVEKSGHELVLPAPDHERVFPVAGYTLGYVRDLTHGDGIDIGLGGQFTLNDMPDRLERYYGDDVPYSFEVFFRIRPSRMKDEVMDHGNQMK